MYDTLARVRASDVPARLPMQSLDSLWFQVTGLLCNLECTHCLVDSSPRNRTMRFLEREVIRKHLDDAVSLGVKEVYFTGGEPFLHREMTGIIGDTLAAFPATVLTNGTLITERVASELGSLAADSLYSLEVRVSMDHPDPGRNDAVRGPGAHAKAIRAALRLQEAGLLPIVTTTEYLSEGEPAGTVYDAFLHLLKNAGIRRPRLKVLPVFHTGKLEDPSSGGAITGKMMDGFDPLLLQCSQARVVAADGIYACPILVGKPVARVGGSDLRKTAGEVSLAHHACRTCYETGMTCGNF